MNPVLRNRGFTLFEFAISAALLGVLAGVLLMRSLSYSEEAERAAAQQLVATLRRALQLRSIEVTSREGNRGLRRLVEENPLDWLAQKPTNYLGEYYAPDLEKMPGGNWVFDRRDKCLIYLLSGHRSFAPDASNLLKFKVKFAHSPRKAGPIKEGPPEVPLGVVLDQITDQASTITD